MADWPAHQGVCTGTVGNKAASKSEQANDKVGLIML